MLCGCANGCVSLHSDINECADPTACDELTACTNVPGTYTCADCPASYHNFTFPERPRTHSCVLLNTSCTGNTTDELGARIDCSLSLDRAPSSPVVLSLYSDDASEAAVTPPIITIDGSNWNSPLQVQVVGVRDELTDGDAQFCVWATAQYVPLVPLCALN